MLDLPHNNLSACFPKQMLIFAPVSEVSYIHHNIIFQVSQVSAMPQFPKTGAYLRTRFSTIFRIPYSTMAMTHNITIAMINLVN